MFLKYSIIIPLLFVFIFSSLESQSSCLSTWRSFSDRSMDFRRDDWRDFLGLSLINFTSPLKLYSIIEAAKQRKKLKRLLMYPYLHSFCGGDASLPFKKDNNKKLTKSSLEKMKLESEESMREAFSMYKRVQSFKFGKNSKERWQSELIEKICDRNEREIFCEKDDIRSFLFDL